MILVQNRFFAQKAYAGVCPVLEINALNVCPTTISSLLTLLLTAEEIEDKERNIRNQSKYFGHVQKRFGPCGNIWEMFKNILKMFSILGMLKQSKLLNIYNTGNSIGPC